MSSLTIRDMQVGMIVVTPTSLVPYLTEDKRYVVLAVHGDDWISIQDDTGEENTYHSHLFIEANVYYTMIVWLVIMRLFEISPKDM
jgi:hypothetical protein